MRHLKEILKHWKFILVSLTLLAISIAIIVVCFTLKSTSLKTTVSLEDDNQIDFTPAQIESIRNIKKWEFLSVQMEEIVDTVEKRTILPNKELIRIYHGYIGLGVDLSEAKEGWISISNDSVSMTLPKIKILNDEFIDEGRTTTFLEEGNWDASTREAMYAMAEKQMLARLKKNDVYKQAEDNGRTQMAALMKSFGFNKITITYE